MPQFGAKQPQGGFFDSDFASIDDLLAVSLLFGLQAKGDCLLAVVTMSRPNLQVAGFADAVERFYHGPGRNFSQLPPIGMPTEGAPGDTSPAFTAPFLKKKPDGTPLYQNHVRSAIDTGDPTTLIRNYLDAQHDHDAFFVLSGPATNLAAALAFPGLKAKIAAKIKLLVVAGGAFPQGPAEPHMKADVAAARKLFAEWPTPVVACGVEVGDAIGFPGAGIDERFGEDNPVADAYRAYRSMPYDAPSLALCATLHAARPGAGYFQLSGPGRIGVDDQGRTSFTESEEGMHRYLIADPGQKDKVRQAFVDLASTRPEIRRPTRPPDANLPAPPVKK